MQVRGFSSATHNRAREIMYHHVKKLMYAVRVDTPERPLMSVAKMPENVE
jgi:hypothetical protein